MSEQEHGTPVWELNLSRKENETRLAYHEAGHAVVAWVLDLGIKEVAMPDAKRGYSDHLRSFDDVKGEVGEKEARRRWAVMQMAGGCSQSRWRTDIGFFGCEEDNARVIENVWRLCELTDDDETTWRSRIQTRTNELVEKHWSQIEAVATALLERRHLSGEQATEIINAASPGLD